MGFDKKTDFETGRTLDLNKSYHNMIKPGVEDAGLECIRADEIVHSGLIDTPMYQRLLEADVVVADLSTSNKNAFYELGVRHALRPFTTVVICEDGAKTPPFDVNHILIRKYHHLGEDIGFDEAMRFRKELKEAILKIMSQAPEDKGDSPVYEYIKKLKPPFVETESKPETVADAAGAVGKALDDAVAVSTGSDKTEEDPASSPSHSALLQEVDEAQRNKDFVTAKALLSSMRKMIKKQAPEKPEDPYIVQRLALVTYKSKFPTEEQALKDARELLNLLEPATSNDTETLGLWGAVHKRLCDLTQDRKSLDEAVRGYERGFFLRNDYYNGINLAYMLNVRAKAPGAEPAEAIADFVQAQRVRKEVLAICQDWLKNLPPLQPGASAEAEQQNQSSKYWVLATIAEAYFGLGDEATGEQRLAEAFAVASADWMKDSTREQIDKLKLLLADSPLRRIN
jgi:hypothetical protein